MQRRHSLFTRPLLYSTLRCSSHEGARSMRTRLSIGPGCSYRSCNSYVLEILCVLLSKRAGCLWVDFAVPRILGRQISFSSSSCNRWGHCMICRWSSSLRTKQTVERAVWCCICTGYMYAAVGGLLYSVSCLFENYLISLSQQLGCWKHKFLKKSQPF